MADIKPDGAEHVSAPPETIEGLFAAQESALLSYARRLVNDPESAEDIVQDAFLKLHAQFDSVRKPQAWLYRTVHNLALNHLRSGRKIVPLAPTDADQAEPVDAAPLPDEQIARMEAIGQARSCLDGLDARSQELIRLKFEEGLSYKEISANTKLSVSNVGYLLHHALKDLAASLKKNGVIS